MALQYSCLEIHGHRSLAAYSPWSCKELDTTELTHTHTYTHTGEGRICSVFWVGYQPSPCTWTRTHTSGAPGSHTFRLGLDLMPFVLLILRTLNLEINYTIGLGLQLAESRL